MPPTPFMLRYRSTNRGHTSEYISNNNLLAISNSALLWTVGGSITQEKVAIPSKRFFKTLPPPRPGNT
jgi:hypothetical protein